MHLTTLRNDDTGCKHPWMHSHVRSTSGERYWRHGRHFLDIKYVEERVQHVVLALAKRVAAGDYEVVLCVHVIDQSRVCIPRLDNGKADRVKEVYKAILSRGTDVATAFHNSIVMLGRYLGVLEGE